MLVIMLLVLYDDFVNHTLQTVEELYPQAVLFVDVIKAYIDKWLKDS